MIEHFRKAVSETTDRVVVSACAAMPSSCWGVYRRVAIVEVPTGVKVKAIDPRRMTVIATKEKLNVGSTARCAFDRAVSDLIDKASL
jgi:hypothetical protein